MLVATMLSLSNTESEKNDLTYWYRSTLNKTPIR